MSRLQSRTVESLPAGIAAGAFALYAAASVTRHERLETGFDLGVFEQAVRSYAQLRAPVATLKGPGVDLLGDHFHPILATLAPLYRLFPGPSTLLLAQAALLAFSAVPVTRVAMRRLGPAAGVGLGVAYALSWGIVNAAAFDFHEVCFAVPLLALTLERLALGRWRAAAAWALPLVLVKEDLPLTFLAVGVYLALRGQRRMGMALAGFGLAAYLAIVFVVIPALGAGHGYTYWDNLGRRGHPTGVAEIGRHLLAAPLQLALSGARLRTLVLLLAPTAFLAVRSPLLVIAVPTIAWRFLSTNPYYWGTDFHYNAILMPIVFVAFVDAVAALGAGPGRWGPRLARLAVPVSLAVTAVLCAGLPLPQLARGTGPQAAPLRELASRASPQQRRRATTAQRLLRRIPDGATVAASNALVPQLTGRTTVYLFPTYPRSRLAPDWIVTTTDGWCAANAAPARRATLRPPGYRLVARRDGILLLRRGRAGAAPTCRRSARSPPSVVLPPCRLDNRHRSVPGGSAPPTARRSTAPRHNEILRRRRQP